MTTMNNFGCVAADVINKLTTGSYVPTTAELGGSNVVDGAIAGAVDEIIQSMPEEVFKQLTQIDLEFLELRAVAGALTVQTTFAPVQPGKTYVWAGQPRFFRERPHKKTDILPDDEFFDDSLYAPLAELVEGVEDTDYEIDDMTDEITWLTTTADYAIDTDTGIITFREALEAQDQVLASYMPDLSDTAYVIDSLAATASDGAAYRLATRLYPRASSQWEYVQVLQEQFTTKLASLKDKTWIPPELRLMTFWKEVVPVSAVGDGKIFTGRIIRG